MLKIIYAGTPEFAVPALQALLQSDHQVLAVYTQPDRPAGRGRKIQSSPVKTCALANNIPVYQPDSLKNSAECERLAGFQADLMVVAAYGLLLPAQVLEIPRLGCINIHASLLPRWRGAAPIQRAIQAGDEITGITIMQMDEGLDTGDMLMFESLPIATDWNSAELLDHLKLLGSQLLMEALDKLESGQLEGIAQDHERSTYAARLSKQEAEIAWSKDADTLLREIRAFVPWPVSFTHLEKTNVRIWQARVNTRSLSDLGNRSEHGGRVRPDFPDFEAHSGNYATINRGNMGRSPISAVDSPQVRQTPSHSVEIPGQIIDHNRDGIFVSCRDSVLQITQLQLAGKTRASAAQLLNSRNLTGMIFT